MKSQLLSIRLGRPLILIVILTLVTPAPAATTTLHVSPAGADENPGTEARPFATIARAQQAVRHLVAQGQAEDIHVTLAAGRYQLTEPLTFTPADAGPADTRVTYAATAGADVVISGGRSLTGWQRQSDGTWTTELPDVAAGRWNFRQLFLDDARLDRARWPNPGDGYLDLKEIEPADEWQVMQRFVVDRPLPCGNLAQVDAEAVMLIIWSSTRNYVRSSDAESFTTEFPVGWRGSPACQPRPLTRVYLENSPALLDEPGEWYLDRDTGRLTLLAPAQADLPTAEAVAPVLTTLIRVHGTAAHPVLNLHFRGIRFQHTAWRMPLGGYQGTQAAVHGGRYLDDPTYMLPAAVELQYAQDCSFEACTIAHAGANGIALGRGACRNRVRGCHVYDIAANGVVIGYQQRANETPRRFFETDWIDPADTPTANVVSDNHIHHCAQVHFGAVGYFERFSAETRCTHNRIHDLPYSGISTGFTWNDVPTSQRDSTIAYNHIHDVMLLLHDGGGIYTLGYQPGTVLHHNLIENVPNGHGLYTDYSTSRMVLENNVVVRAGVYGYQHHYGHSNVLRNNIFVSSGVYAIHHARDGAKNAYTFERNIVVADRCAPPDHPWYRPVGDDDGEILRPGAEDFRATYDHNLYWDPRDQAVRFGPHRFTQWQEKGQDIHSRVADPGFVDAANGDYRLADDSPARQLGIESVDLRDVGPRAPYRRGLGLD